MPLTSVAFFLKLEWMKLIFKQNAATLVSHIDILLGNFNDIRYKYAI